MNTRNFKEMTAEEQCRWVTDFKNWLTKGQRLAKLNTEWTNEDREAMECGLRLLSAWTFAQEFVEKALHFGDYASRAYRLSVYIDKIKDSLSASLTVNHQDGRTYAVVAPGTPLRRRGRPTLEEQKAKQRGETFVVEDDSPETRKSRAIAEMLGIEVVVAGKPPREKNNAELAAERKAKAEREKAQNPQLFEQTPVKEEKSAELQTCAQVQNDAYEMRMFLDKLNLSQLAFFLSPELAKRTEMVRGLRLTYERSSERGKLLAEMGGDKKEIEGYNTEAQEAVEAVEAIEADVDEELAILHKRLYLDMPFVEKVKGKYDIEKVKHITRPYYEKVKKADPAIDVRIKTIIEQENPEYAAKMKADEEKKQEVSEILRYLKRKDKPNVKQRIETMEKRYQRLIELLGEEDVKVYRPIVDAAIEDYEKNFKAKDKAKAEKKTVKTARKESQKSTKQENNKSTKK